MGWRDGPILFIVIVARGGRETLEAGLRIWVNGDLEGYIRVILGFRGYRGGQGGQGEVLGLGFNRVYRGVFKG